MFGYIGYKILEFIVIATPYPVTYLIAKFGAMALDSNRRKCQIH